MHPDAPNAIAVLLSRRSVPALKLREPGPSSAQIDVALDAALCAPDHGGLGPARFLLIHGGARARLAELLATRLREREPETPPTKLERVRVQALHVPLIIAVGASLKADPKIPESEQLLSVGASVMNLLNAFHAQGYGAIWLTGGNAYDPLVAAALGFGGRERCVGFLYVGTDDRSERPLRPRPDRSAHTRDWSG